MTTELLKDAEPFFFPGGPDGCLLIHGFTGTPFEMRGLGQYLAARNYTVFGPRLSHHGSKPPSISWIGGKAAPDISGRCSQL
jgi:carboxylesterase